MAILPGHHRVVPDLPLGPRHDPDLPCPRAPGTALARYAARNTHPPGTAPPASAPRYPIPSNALATETPSVSVNPYAFSSPNTPAQTPDPIRLCPNRLPSSSVQLISSSGASVTTSRSFRLRITSSPASTPSAPSNFPAAGLAVQMAAEQHRRPRRIASRPPGEHVADRVHPHRQPQRLAFGAEPVARPPVHIGQSQPPHAAFRGRADLGKPHQASPKGVCRRFENWSVSCAASCPAFGFLQACIP